MEAQSNPRAPASPLQEQRAGSHLGTAGDSGAGHQQRASGRLCVVFQHEMLRYKDVCYYMLFALAAYGWPMYLMRKPACGLCQLARSCS